VTEGCELVVLLAGSPDAVSRLASALPEISFEQIPAPSGEGVESLYLTARMHDPRKAEEYARRIGEMAGVSAAYVKPGGEPPL